MGVGSGLFASMAVQPTAPSTTWGSLNFPASQLNLFPLLHLANLLFTQPQYGLHAGALLLALFPGPFIRWGGRQPRTPRSTHSLLAHLPGTFSFWEGASLDHFATDDGALPRSLQLLGRAPALTTLRPTDRLLALFPGLFIFWGGRQL